MKLAYRPLERLVRGFANHRRIQILELLKTTPELSVADVAERIHINIKTAGAHLVRLAIEGLVMKRNDGVSVRHKLTERAEHVLKFLRTLA